MTTMIRRRTAIAAVVLAALLGSLAGTSADTITSLKRYTETKTAPSISSNAFTANLSNGTQFQVTLNANVTGITFSNPVTASGYSNAFTLALTQDGTGGRTVTGWPAAVKWPGGSAPTVTATANKTDLYSFVTYDGGTTWWGLIVAQNL